MAFWESASESGEWGCADGRRGAVGIRSARWSYGALSKKKSVEKWQTGGVRDKVVLWEKWIIKQLETHGGFRNFVVLCGC